MKNKKQYFIRSTEFEGHYLHFKGHSDSGDDTYQLLYGHAGAAIWNGDAASAFILQSTRHNLEPVNVNEVL